MEKIPSFKISKLGMSGFKCFAEPREFVFGDRSVIAGDNGLGKTGIADAIAYAITGAPYFGDGRIDRLYAEGSKNLRVSLEIRLPDGLAHTLARERTKDRTSLTYDGLPVRQSDLTVMFGEKDLFLSIFNPLYFTEALGENAGNLLERYLPAVPQEKLLETLDEADRALLANERIASPEGFLKSLREEIKEIENDVVYTEGQRDLLRAQTREAEAALSKKREELAETEERVSALESKKTEGVDIPKTKERLADLRARRDEAAKETPAPADTAEIDAEILSALENSRKRKRRASFPDTRKKLLPSKCVSKRRKSVTTPKKRHSRSSRPASAVPCANKASRKRTWAR
jgi:DNA repair exonuclease SbcCD ATPase subunit